MTLNRNSTCNLLAFAFLLDLIRLYTTNASTVGTTIASIIPNARGIGSSMLLDLDYVGYKHCLLR